jgi:hypothetical protein
MKSKEQYIRYPSGVSEKKLSDRLGLYWEHPMKDLWRICEIILEKECFLHFSIITYWSLLEERNMENVFSITPFIREIWESVKMNL